LVDETRDQERTLIEGEQFDIRRKALADALSVLNERERRIFEAIQLTEKRIKLKVLAEEFGISHERVRQINVCALKKVERAVKNRVAAIETPARLPVVQ
jgi:RNA polymerase sigma-32 factor